MLRDGRETRRRGRPYGPTTSAASPTTKQWDGQERRNLFQLLWLPFAERFHRGSWLVRRPVHPVHHNTVAASIRASPIVTAAASTWVTGTPSLTSTPARSSAWVASERCCSLECRQQSWTGLDEHDARSSDVDVAKVGRRGPVHELADRACNRDAGRPATNYNNCGVQPCDCTAGSDSISRALECR